MVLQEARYYLPVIPDLTRFFPELGFSIQHGIIQISPPFSGHQRRMDQPKPGRME